MSGASYYKGGHTGPIEPRPDYRPLHIQPSAPLATVRVHAPEHPQGFIVINATDFDPERHTLWIDASGDAPADGAADAPAKARKK